MTSIATSCSVMMTMIILVSLGSNLRKLNLRILDRVNYQNIVSISENLDRNNHQQLKNYLEQISQNWEKQLSQHTTITFAGYLLIYSVLLFLAYIFVVFWWDDKEDYK